MVLCAAKSLALFAGKVCKRHYISGVDFVLRFCFVIGAVKKRAIKKTATTLKRVGKQSFLWYNKFDEKIPTKI